MCSTCGCNSNDEIKIMLPGEDIENSNELDVLDHNHHHHHHHGDHHHHEHSDHIENGREMISLEEDILQKNNLLAARNRGFLEAKNIIAFNLMSSPGSGKTTLLEKTITMLGEKHQIYVIEGDQQSMNDAERIAATNAKVVQVNTGKGCHLDSEMVNRAFKKLSVEEQSLLFIENVGNLVCPALFDLGENYRVVIMSVTEGEDKPLKYPTIFQMADLLIINKTDLLPYLEYDMEKAREYALRVNHHLKIFELSATTGEGLGAWLTEIEKCRDAILFPG